MIEGLSYNGNSLAYNSKTNKTNEIKSITDKVTQISFSIKLKRPHGRNRNQTRIQFLPKTWTQILKGSKMYSKSLLIDLLVATIMATRKLKILVDADIYACRPPQSLPTCRKRS